MQHIHTKEKYTIKLDLNILGGDTSGYHQVIMNSIIHITVPKDVSPEQCIADEIGAWLDAELSKHEFKYPEV